MDRAEMVGCLSGCWAGGVVRVVGNGVDLLLRPGATR